VILKQSIPWPKITTKTGKVPLMKEYAMNDMWYLDTQEARPIFEKQANIIIENEYKGIVDIGCRHGPVNEILHDKGYQFYDYYGFDTSPEPIQVAEHQWCHKPTINYKVADWSKLEKVSFKVDVIIFSGVLLYEKDHYKMFKDTMQFYNCSNGIIQEPHHTQKHYDDRLDLKTITENMEQYDFWEEHIIDAEIFCGRRLVAHAKLL